MSDLATRINHDFCRRLLSYIFAEIKAILPDARARDASAMRLPTGRWLFELNDPLYGGHFQWTGRADNGWHAKAQGWKKLLNKLRPEDNA